MVTLNQLLFRTSRERRHTKKRSTALIGCPQKKGHILKLLTRSPKKPNSAIRKVARVRLFSTGKVIIAYICGRGFLLQEHNSVLIRGGRVPDLPGVRYKLVKGVYDFSWSESEMRYNRRSKYAIKKIYLRG